MTSGPLQESLEAAHFHLDALRQGDDGYQRASVEGLMSIAYELGKVLSSSPELRSDAAVQRFVEETVVVLKERTVDLAYYPWTVVRRLQGSWEANEWEQLCVARSGIQFFIDLFRETALAEDVGAIDPGDIDEFIRERGDDEGYLTDEEIPPEIPLTHWWWWYPEAPRRRKGSQPPR